MKIQLSWTEIRLILPKAGYAHTFRFLNWRFWAIVIIALSIGSWCLFFSQGLTVAYNDARAHMNMARLVVDNLKPGLAQIGSVWLPLNHILTLTLVWNDWLWQTGLAGSIFSMIAYILTVPIVYKLTKSVTQNIQAAFLGTLIFATNLNILYMQSTPMTEMLLLLFFTASTYFLYKWSQSKGLVDLLFVGLSVFLATLTRYDGWFLFIVIAASLLVILLQDLRKGNQKNLSKIEGPLVLFGTLAGFGIFLWILYNLAIFNDPFYFAFGPYSASAQQARIEAAGSLPTKYNILLSLLAYWWAMVNNAGFLVLTFSIVGLMLFIFKYKLSSKGIVLYTLLTPLFFHIIALYLGHSILILPELGVNVTQEARGSWFNVRYGLMILPAVAFFSAYLATKLNVFKFILIGLIAIQPLLFINSNNIITITDGVSGTSSLDVRDVSDWLVANAKNDHGLILTSISFNNALMFSTGLPLRRVIHEGTGHYWEDSLVDPQRHAKWIVMSNGDTGDPVYDALIKEENSSFLKFFDLKQRFKHINVYELRNVPTGVTYVTDGHLEVDGKEFLFVGMNSYDLLYRTPEEINQTLFLAKQAGIEVVRFWGFGNGLTTGPQPALGVFDEKRLINLDRIIATADQLQMKLIITMSNYWDDYGGVRWYLDQVRMPSKTNEDLDRFFTSAETQKHYKKFVQHVVTRRNTIDGVLYSDEASILAWELMNEPRSSSNAAGYVVTNWTKAMINFINTFDDNHIVLSGHEGFLQGSTYTSSHTGPWFSDLNDLDNLPVVTAHFYKIGDYKLTEEFRHPVLSTWKAQADTLHKPLILEEIGFSKDKKDNDGVAREILYKNLFDEAKGHDVPGVVLWNWALKIDDSYGISPLDPKDANLIQIIKQYSESIQK